MKGGVAVAVNEITQALRALQFPELKYHYETQDDQFPEYDLPYPLIPEKNRHRQPPQSHFSTEPKQAEKHNELNISSLVQVLFYFRAIGFYRFVS